MAKRPIKTRVDEFKKNKPKSAKLTAQEWEEIRGLGNDFDIVMTAFYFGYMRAMKAQKGGVI